ncbi:hypothetical protein B1R32_12715 [Abditibacterium utsteinense]|uniref:Glycoside hydrolase family 5 domain-containing protein n=1 Tax=Abditibacterium utsteinense TaxID=1960156 RepID=A0A2S8SP81_9BACT|nr:hypothetical protein [Abditibacterium utsteinense]PQV62603.1 hypothetical protein B1R32_12715 [Abditibacterium utsteinense]
MNRFLILFLTVSALYGSALAQVSTPVGAGASLIETPNPGFEGDYAPVASASDSPNAKAVITGSIAPGWGDNSNWADVNINYARDTTNPHRGPASQKITVGRVASGAVQFVQQVPLREGRIHVWKLWMRGRPGDAVDLIIRKAGAPYTTYASETATLSAEWQEFRVFGAIPENTDGFLMVRATSPMTFLLDDSALEDLTSATSGAPARVGNMIAGGGSFEAGIPYGWSTRFQGEQGFQPKDPRPTIDATTAAVGQKSLRCDLPAGSSARVSTPLLKFNFGREHTLSFWAKSRLPETRIDANLEKGFSGNMTLGTQWKRYTVSGTLPFMPYTQLRFQIPNTATGNTIWIDGVQFEEKSAASANYLAPEPIELSLNLPQPGHVLLENEVGTVQVSTAGQLPGGARLQLSALDLRNKTQSLPVVKLPAKSFRLPTMNNRRGTWKLRAQVVSAGGQTLSAPYELVWARLPRPKIIDPKNSYFGLHLPLSQNYFDIARRIGVRRTRLHDTSMIGKWNTVEPEKDRFQFFDEGIDMANRAGIEVLGMLDGAPRWTTTKPREGYWGFWNIPDQPGAVDRWENYVRRTVGHFKGRINQWEIWNEPWGAWWLGSENSSATPQLYGELSRRAYAAAKAVNPGVSILGIDTYPGNTWTDLVLPHVTPKDFDGFSFHDYSDGIFGGPNAIPFLRRKEFIDAQAKYGQPKPLWNTEGGPSAVGSWLAPETGGMPAAQQATFMVRHEVTYMAAGVRAFYLYAMHSDPDFGGFLNTTSEYDRSVKPLLAARAVLASLVDGLGVPIRSEPVKGVDFYTYPGGKVSVLWSYEGDRRSVKVPGGTRVLDVWGNQMKTSNTVSVAGEPIYFMR